MQYLLSKEEYDNLVHAKEQAEEAVCIAIKLKIDQRLKELRAEARQQLMSFCRSYPRAYDPDPILGKPPVKLLCEKMGEIFERFSHIPDL